MAAFGAVQVLEAGRLVEPNRPITIRDLLTHTCGLSNELQDTPVAALYRNARMNGDPTRSLTALIDALAECPSRSSPEHAGTTAWASMSLRD